MGVLTAKQEELLVLFKGAIEREREAQKVYSEMLPLNDDPTISRVIETFIEQEKQHEEALLNIYNVIPGQPETSRTRHECVERPTPRATAGRR